MNFLCPVYYFSTQFTTDTIKGFSLLCYLLKIGPKPAHPFTFNPLIAHAQYYISLTHSDPPQKLSFQAVPSLHKKRPRSVREYPSPTDQSPSRSQHLQLLSPLPPSTVMTRPHHLTSPAPDPRHPLRQSLWILIMGHVGKP